MVKEIMRNLLVRMAYDGTAYHGWQVQKNAVTVQQTLQDAMEKVFEARPDVIGCSRTDAGVHARDFCFNFRTDSKIGCENLVLALNARLPEDIAVLHCTEVPENFHARYDVLYKEYIYQIYSSPVRNPFLFKRALHYTYPLKIDLMNRAAQAYLGSHDFSAFCATGSNVKGTVRTVTLSEVTQQGDCAVFRVRANGFLYNMVRIMAGTLLYVSRGKIDAGDVGGIIRSLDRCKAGPTLPPHGLYLNRVDYGEIGGQ